MCGRRVPEAGFVHGFVGRGLRPRARTFVSASSGRAARTFVSASSGQAARKPVTVASGRGAPSSSPFRLAPSDFAFLWEECQRCFYLKVHGTQYRPRAPFPSIFGKIDLEMKRFFRGVRTTDILPDMKPGVFLCEDDDAWVESMPITPAGAKGSVYVRGMLDCLVKFDDGTYGIVDFKTSNVSKSSSLYSRQLHAYARAIESPGSGSELDAGVVSDIGLVIYEPSGFSATSPSGAALTGGLTYLHVPRDDVGFEKYLKGVLDVLQSPQAPKPPKPNRYSRRNAVTCCPYCQFLEENGISLMNAF